MLILGFIVYISVMTSGIFITVTLYDYMGFK